MNTDRWNQLLDHCTAFIVIVMISIDAIEKDIEMAICEDSDDEMNMIVMQTVMTMIVMQAVMTMTMMN